MDSEQTTDQTFRVTTHQTGAGVSRCSSTESPLSFSGSTQKTLVGLSGSPLHLETQIDRVSCPPRSDDLRRRSAA